MPLDPHPEYMTIEQAAVYLNVRPATIRRLLRQHGLGDFLRASISKQVLIRKQDLDNMDLGQGDTRPGGGRAGRTGRNRGTGAA